MPERQDRLKGGVGGKSVRMHERFKVDKPDQDLLTRYFRHYSDRDLYLGTGDIVIPTSEYLFGNTHPTHFDFGCGRGEYILSMAGQYPERNFVGVDEHVRSLYLWFGLLDYESKNLF